MAFATITRSVRTEGSNAPLSSLRARFAAWKAYRRTVNELDSLSDRELADLGLHRSGIRAVAAETAYGA